MTDDQGGRVRRAAALVEPDQGRINRRISADDDVYRLEQERIFARCWLFVGHESQVRNPGDLVGSMMGEDPALLVHDRHGTLRVMLNSCSHKGRTVCVHDRGADAYYGELDKQRLGLRQARPRPRTQHLAP